MKRTVGSPRRPVPVALAVVSLLAAVLASLVGPTGAGAVAAPTATSVAPTSPEVQAEVAAGGDTEVIAVTRASGAEVVDEVLAEVPSASVSDVDAGAAPVVAMSVDAEGLAALQRSPEVEQILPNRTHTLAYDAWYEQVGGPTARTAGWDGRGRAIAVLDSGVQSSHPYLAGKVIAEACFSRTSSVNGTTSLCPGGADVLTDVAGAATPCSGITGCDHGSHVAGIAAGGPVSSPRALAGVAPAASIVAIDIFTRGTTTSACNGPAPCLLAYDSDIIGALDWVAQRRNAGDARFAGLDAVNLSLGGGLFASACDAYEPTAPYIATLKSMGIATVAATGNNFATGSMASPACISTVVSVAATAGPTTFATYSNVSSGTRLVAPGTDVVSSVPTSSYMSRTGTSMATPMVSGALAVLRQSRPTASVDELVALLRSSGDPVSTPVGSIPGLRLDRALGLVAGPPGPPFGSWDLLQPSIGSLTVAGWAIDPESAGPIDVRVTVDGVSQVVRADLARPDVAAAFPGYGTGHGFAATVAAGGGRHTVCTTALGIGVGGDTSFGCRGVDVPTGSPVGALDVVSTGPGVVGVAGWAIDPDTAAPIDVHVYVDSAGRALRADGFRADLAAFFGPYGGSHAFQVVLPAGPGPHTVCAYGINVGGGGNAALGCRTVVVPTGSPFGSLDTAVRGLDGQLRTGGWAIDPDTGAPIAVHLYVQNQLVAVATADQPRPDVGAAFPAYGAAHGYSATVAAPPSGTVCAYGINVGGGGNALLGCRSFSSPTGPPIGALDRVSRNLDGTVTAAGWAIDPDTGAPIAVHLYVQNQLVAVATADQPRPDVGAAFPAYGAAHGYSATVAAPPSGTVCAYGIDVGGGVNALLGCRALP